MLGSLYFSEVAGFIPCKLCWYQRILMYPLTIILLVSILRCIDEDAPYFVLTFSLVGIGVSTYHYLLQTTDLFTSSTTCSVGAPCTATWINWFGFVTIPFLALIAFLIITITMIIVLTGTRESVEDNDDYAESEVSDVSDPDEAE